MKCINCKYWIAKQDTPFCNNMGKCTKLSAKDGDEYPNLNETGIESIPLCAHDGAGAVYDTKSWFRCIHFVSLHHSCQ